MFDILGFLIKNALKISNSHNSLHTFFIKHSTISTSLKKHSNCLNSTIGRLGVYSYLKREKLCNVTQ